MNLVIIVVLLCDPCGKKKAISSMRQLLEDIYKARRADFTTKRQLL